METWELIHEWAKEITHGLPTTVQFHGRVHGHPLISIGFYDVIVVESNLMKHKTPGGVHVAHLPRHKINDGRKVEWTRYDMHDPKFFDKLARHLGLYSYTVGKTTNNMG
jgi:hypothetical protein